MGSHGGILVIIGLANVVFGFGTGIPMLYFAVRRSRKREAALSRIQQVEGEIVRSSVEKRRTPKQGRKYKYQPIIEFSYEFDGETYTSNRRAYNMLFGATSERGAHKTAREYPEGKTVSVYVDPNDPENGFLDIEATRQAVTKGFLTYIGGMMVFFGVVGLGAMALGIYVLL